MSFVYFLSLLVAWTLIVVIPVTHGIPETFRQKQTQNNYHNNQYVNSNSNVNRRPSYHQLRLWDALHLQTALQQRIQSNDASSSTPISIYGFYHVRENAGRDVMQAQLNLLDGKRKVNKKRENGGVWERRAWSSLLDISSSLQITLELDRNRKNFTGYVQNMIGELNYGQGKVHVKDSVGLPVISQISAINGLHQHCRNVVQQGRISFVYYLHTPEVDSMDDNSPQASWLHLMNTFNMEYPSICLRALMQGYIACGVENQDGHYSGNIWWADCDHVAGLPPLEDTSQVANFLFNVSAVPESRAQFAKLCGYSGYNSYANHFETPVSSEKYEARLPLLLQTYELPQSFDVDIPKSYPSRNCRSASRNQPYVSAAEYLYGVNLPPVQAKASQTVQQMSPNFQHVLGNQDSAFQIWHKKILSEDVSLFRRAVQETQSRRFTIRGFYHISRWQPYWKEVVEEQLLLLDGHRRSGHRPGTINPSPWSSEIYSSLLKASDKLMITVSGSHHGEMDIVREAIDQLSLKNADKIELRFNLTLPRGTYSEAASYLQRKFESRNDLSEGEYSSLRVLQDYCRSEVAEGRRAIVYYMHSKGACCIRQKRPDPVASWREAMNVFNIEYPSICLRAILLGYPTCGFGEQERHYSGNFWWADCQHIAALPSLQTKFDAWKLELFPFNVSTDDGTNAEFGNKCAFNTFSCGVDHYKEECPFELYSSRLESLILSSSLPPSMHFNRKDLVPLEEAARTCPTFFSSESSLAGPYAEQLGFFSAQLPKKMSNLYGKLPDPNEAALSQQAIKDETLVKESRLFRYAASQAAKDNISIKGFYHVTRTDVHWRLIIEEQLQFVDGKHFPARKKKRKAVSLLGESSGLHVNVGGSSKEDKQEVVNVINDLKLTNAKKLTVSFSQTLGQGEFESAPSNKKSAFMANADLSTGEVSTMMALHQHCTDLVSQGNNGFVYYFHNHGQCCHKKKDIFSPIASWRDAMNTFTLEYPSICLRALLSGHTTCGIDYQDGHYSGNFWWATCEHVAALPAISNRFDFAGPLFFLFNVDPNMDKRHKFAEACGYKTFLCKVDHFKDECPIESYASRLRRLVDQYSLPNSYGLTGLNATLETREKCLYMRAMYLSHAAPTLVQRQVLIKSELRAIADKEAQIFARAVQETKRRNYSIQGFYHVSRWMQHWKEVVEEQMLLLDGKRKFGNRTFHGISRIPLKWEEGYWSSLLAASDNLLVNVAGQEKEDLLAVRNAVRMLGLQHASNLEYLFSHTVPRNDFGDSTAEEQAKMLADPDLTEGESSSLIAVHKYCKDTVRAGKKAFVYYFHSKGGCCSRDVSGYNPVSAWREIMNTFTIELPSICLRALLNGSATCGYAYSDNPSPHYSGNFWWADCDHVAALPPVVSRFDTYAAEFFLFTTQKQPFKRMQFANACGYNTFRCGAKDSTGEYKTVNHYNDECMLDMYIDRMHEVVRDYKLPPQAVFASNPPVADRSQFPSCFLGENQQYDGETYRYHFQLKRGYGKG